MTSTYIYGQENQKIVSFKPTFLYIKKHEITGKLYFGKTTKDHVLSYNGSGKHWLSHVKKHGESHVTTLWYCLFLDKESVEHFAISFSKMNNIVQSDEWLNLKEENGLDGGSNKGRKNTTASEKLKRTSPAKCKESLEYLGNVSIDDERWSTGEIVGVNYETRSSDSTKCAISKGVRNSEKYKNHKEKISGTTLFKDKQGNFVRTHKSDERVLSGELVGCTRGKKYTIEQKNKLSSILSGEGNPAFGKMWINDGLSNLRVDKDSSLPEGWCRGLLKRHNNSII